MKIQIHLFHIHTYTSDTLYTYTCDTLHKHIHTIFYFWRFLYGKFRIGIFLPITLSWSFYNMQLYDIFSTYLQKGDIKIDGSRIVLRVSNDIFYSIRSAQVFVTATNSYSILARRWSVIDRASKYQPARISLVHDVHTTKCTLLVFQNMRMVFNDLIVIA